MDETDTLVPLRWLPTFSPFSWGQGWPGPDPVHQVDYLLHEKVVDVPEVVLALEVVLKVQVLESRSLIC